MKYDELPENMQKQIDELKHCAQTIQSDVRDAQEFIESIDKFRLQVDNCMDEIISKAKGVRAIPGTQQRGVVHA